MASASFSSASVLRPPSSSSPSSPQQRPSIQSLQCNLACSRFNGKRLVLTTFGHRRLSSRAHPPTIATSVTLPSVNNDSTKKTNPMSRPRNGSTNPREEGSRARDDSMSPRDDDKEPQELTVYEFNEQDRNSPLLLPFNKPGFDMQRLRPVAGLGMIVAFTNKLFDGSLKKRLGITAGVCMVMRYNQQKGGCLYEATYSFYFGDLGHISVQGPYAEYEDTTLAVTGGSGIFTGVYGTVRLKNVKFPTSLFYRFKLYGIPKLPSELIWDTVPPTENVKPAPNASSPGVALHNFTD